MFATILEGVIALQKQILNDIPSEQALYIPAQATSRGLTEEKPFDLQTAVEKFISFDEKEIKLSIQPNVLMLLGDAGSGKSVFCQDFMVNLWRTFQLGQPIPLLIHLPRLEDPFNHAIEETLKGHGFNDEQVAQLKKEHRFIFILDGYDELHQLKNLYVSNQLEQWQAKTIIVCRTQFLYRVDNVNAYFMPMVQGKRRLDLLRELYVAPFSDKQIDAYLETYAKLAALNNMGEEKEKKQDSTVEQKLGIVSTSPDEQQKVPHAQATENRSCMTRQQLESIPGLKSLITTPFLLHLAVEALPDILTKMQYPATAEQPAMTLPLLAPQTKAKSKQESKEEKTEDKIQESAIKSPKAITGAILYDVFIERWFNRQALKLNTSGHISAEEKDTQKKFWDYCQQLALALKQQQVTFITLPQKKGKFNNQSSQNPFERFFTGHDMEIIRSACPLRKFSEYQYGFMHASMIDYFATRDMYERLKEPVTAEKNVTAVVTVLAEEKTTQSQPVTSLTATPALAYLDLNNPINHRLFASEQRSVQFLADRVDENEHFRTNLWAVIEASKKDKRYGAGAANAMTVLNAAGVTFVGRNFDDADLAEVQLPYAILDSTSFRRANLTRASIQGAWLRQADFSGATVTDLETGERPTVTFNSAVKAIAYSPDGRYLALVSDDKKIHLYDAIKQRLMHIFDGHKSSVDSLSFSPDSLLLASGGGFMDNTIRLWDVEDKKLLHTFKRHKEGVTSLVFAPQGRWLASGSMDETIRLWDLIEKKSVYTFKGHRNWIASLSFDPQGKWLASGSADKTIRVWDMKDKKAVCIFDTHDDLVTSVSFHPQGQWLASGSLDKMVRLWSVRDNQLIHTFEGHTGGVLSLSFTPEGRWLASGSKDMTIRVWDVEDKKLLYNFEGHTDRVDTVSFDSQGHWLASGSTDRTLRLWAVKEKKTAHKVQGHSRYVSSVSFSREGRWLASGSLDGTVRLWDVVDKKLKHIFEGHSRDITSVSFSPEGRWIASGSLDKTVRVWDILNKKLFHVFEGHTSYVNCVNFSLGGRWLASGSSDKTICVWDIIEKKIVRILKGHTRDVESVSFDPLGQWLASGGGNDVWIWDLKEERQVVHLFDGHTGGVNGVSFAPQGRWLASAGGYGDNTVRVWNVEDKKLVHIFKGHTDKVSSVSFAPQGRWLASGSSDLTVRVWDIERFTCLVEIKGMGTVVNSVSWQPGGIALATGNDDTAVRHWQLREEKGGMQAMLTWTSYQAALNATDSRWENVKGLSEENATLLPQRGAHVKTLMPAQKDADKIGAKEEKSIQKPFPSVTQGIAQHGLFAHTSTSTLTMLPSTISASSPTKTDVKRML